MLENITGIENKKIGREKLWMAQKMVQPLFHEYSLLYIVSIIGSYHVRGNGDSGDHGWRSWENHGESGVAFFLFESWAKIKGNMETVALVDNMAKEERRKSL